MLVYDFIAPSFTDVIELFSHNKQFVVYAKIENNIPIHYNVKITGIQIIKDEKDYHFLVAARSNNTKNKDDVPEFLTWIYTSNFESTSYLHVHD